MIRDEAKRRARAEGGKLGGNPNLKPTGKVTSKVNLPPNLPPTPSVFSLQSSSSEERKKSLGSPEFENVWELWKHHRIEQQKPLGTIEEEQQRYVLQRFTADEAIEIVRYSITSGARNLITNGDHRTKPSRNPAKPAKHLVTIGGEF